MRFRRDRNHTDVGMYPRGKPVGRLCAGHRLGPRQ